MLGQERLRLLIPKWRDSSKTIESGEVSSLHSTELVGQDYPVQDEIVLRKLDEWQREKSVHRAADLIVSAWASSLNPLITPGLTEAAEFIVNASESASPIARASAAALIGIPNISVSTEHQSQEDDQIDREPRLRSRAKAARNLTRRQPRDSFSWVDLGRMQAALGQDFAAKRSLEIAVKITDQSRFVLRASAKLHAHLHEPDYALKMLQRSDLTPFDPWLMATEISVSELAEKPSRFASKGRRFVQTADVAPYHLSELQAAIATLELKNGKIRRSRKLFNESLAEPNDNVVAQADWASRQISEIEIRQDLLARANMFEVKSARAYLNGDWDSSISASLSWFADDPLSKHSVRSAAFISSMVLGDHVAAERLTLLGMQSHGNDSLLLNEQALFLALQGRVEEAARIHGLQNKQVFTFENHLTHNATGGMILFRAGYTDEGRDAYLNVIAAAKAKSLPWYVSWATLLLAHEEVHARTSQSTEALERLEKVERPYDHKAFSALEQRIRTHQAQYPLIEYPN